MKNYCGICVHFIPQTDRAGNITGTTICNKDKSLRAFWQAIDHCSDFLNKASLPEMYEALRIIKQYLDRPYSDAWYVIVGDPKKQHTLGDVVNEALAKTEGKSCPSGQEKGE